MTFSRFFTIFICWWKKTKKIHSPSLQKIFFLKLHKLPTFMLLSLFHVLNENEGKSKKYINFSWQFIFFSQNCINYPVSSASWRINILSKKDHLYFSSEKRNIYAISRKKFLFTEKVNFFMIFCIFHCFHQTIN